MVSIPAPHSVDDCRVSTAEAQGIGPFVLCWSIPGLSGAGSCGRYSRAPG
jgi:hypothetical protein